MRKFILLLASILLLLNVFAQEIDLNFIDKIVEHDRSKFVNKSAFAESKTYSNSDLIYQRMEWQINPSEYFISGKVTSYFKSRIDGLNEIEFDLSNSLNVDSIISGNTKIDFTHSFNKIKIPLRRSLALNSIDSVSIFYAGAPSEKEGFGTFVASQQPDGTPILWTLSEPYGAMQWWPCKQSLIDKIDSVDIIVETPKKFKTASNGIVVSNKIENEKRKMHWKHRSPIVTYLVAISVTDYATYSDYLQVNDSTQIEILNYVYPSRLEKRKSETSITVEIMDYFNKTIGMYPFANEKYGHAEFGWGGGMEHQTMSFMGSFSFHLIAHELAHQWFGDYITLGSWHDIWLNEGFATYLTGLAYGGVLKEDWWYKWKKSTVERIISEPYGSVYVTDTTSISSIFNGRLSYSKGSYLLQMMRVILGDEAFFNGLRNYFNDLEIANGFAYTHHIKSHMESVGDTSLTEFFDDWFYGEGHPVYSLDYTVKNFNDVVIQLSQEPSHFSVDFFEMPVPIRVYNSTKTDSADFRLVHTKNNQEFTITPGFTVAEIKINPEYSILSKTEKISNIPLYNDDGQIKVYPNPFQDLVQISIPRNEKLFEIKLFTIDGKLKYISDQSVSMLDLSQISTGNYVIQVETNKKTYKQKLVKQ